METIERMKTCSKCREELPTSEFYRDRSKRDGRDHRCRDCAVARKAAYYEENRDRLQEQMKEYRAAHPEPAWLHRYRRRMNAYGHEPVVVPFTLAELIEKCGGACYHCGGEWAELDHFPVSVADGGEHTLENTVLSCREDNLKGIRGAKLRRELITERELIDQHIEDMVTAAYERVLDLAA